uniref:Single-stranded DNA-binding protein n=2 Tax=Schistosoma mansoni TaxID=6183 RepID=A0A5K4F4A6_SCHMA
MNTVKAMYNLNEQIIIIGYQRLIILKTLEQLPITFNGIIEQNDHLNYNLITYIEHKYKINLNMYYLNSTRVKQKQNIVYIIIPRKLTSDNI